DPRTNGGLPPFLIRDRAGVRSGLMELQYCASSSVAENAVLAHPTTLGSVPTNANNQDVVGMGAVAARQARRLLENARRVVAGARTRLGHVVVVDDGSTDDTAARAVAAGAEVIRHPANAGKGAALATGLRALAARGVARALSLDADGQHLPREIPVLLAVS